MPVRTFTKLDPVRNYRLVPELRTLSLPATKQGNDKDGHLYTIIVSGVDQAGNSASATTTLRIN